MASRHDGDLYVTGTLGATRFTAPAGSITNTSIAAGSAGTYLEREKSEQGFATTKELFAPTASVTALTQWLHIVRGAVAEVVSFEAAIAVVASGADRTITVDLQKSTGAGAFATICSATIGFTNASAVRTPVAATFSNDDLVDGDILQVVVTVAGAAGAQATGLTCTLNLMETPN